MKLNYLFTPTEPLPNHTLRPRHKAVRGGDLSYCCPRDKQKASLNKAALALTTQLLETEYRHILINHNYANPCICIEHGTQGYREFGRCLLDVTQPGREPQRLPQEIKLNDETRGSPSQGNRRRNKGLFKSAVTLLWKVTVFPI